VGGRPLRVEQAQANTTAPYSHAHTLEAETDDSIAQHESWTMSFIDLLMLLLTLFVLLLSIKNGAITTKPPVATAKAVHQTVAVVHKDKLIASTLDASPLSQPPSQPALPTIKVLQPQGTHTGMIDDVVEKLRQDYVQQDVTQNDVQISAGNNSINLEISEAILFAPASDELTAEGEQVLQKLSGVLSAYPFRLSVEGHTDNTPIRSAQFPSNWELSASRATKVTRKLIDDGFPADAIRSIGYGDTRPLADNTTPEGRAKNRRVSIVMDLPGDTVTLTAHN